MRPGHDQARFGLLRYALRFIGFATALPCGLSFAVTLYTALVVVFFTDCS